MTFALHWVGQPVLASLAAVLVYRAFNLGLPAVAGLLVRDPVAPLLDAADEHRRPADHHLRRAKSPPLPLG
jgi:hypothetical protein